MHYYHNVSILKAEELNDIVGEAFRLAYARQKQQNRGLLTKTPSFNDIIERQLRRQRPHGMETAIEEATNESLTSKSDLDNQFKESDDYNLLTSDKSKKPSQPNVTKRISTKYVIINIHQAIEGSLRVQVPPGITVSSSISFVKIR